MDIDELFSKDETGAGTLTMISAEMIGLLKEHLDKQSEVRNGEDHNTYIPDMRCKACKLFILLPTSS
jgi:hypothetical protein